MPAFTLDNPEPHTQANLDAFHARLTLEYERLFAEDPEYAHVAGKMTPAELARRVSLGLAGSGPFSVDKDGKGIIATCRHLNVPHTYKAIRDFLNA